MVFHMFASPAIALYLCALVAGAYAMGLFSRKNRFPVNGRTVVITGGSQGMGRGLARLLAKKGASVVIVARDVKKLQAAIEYISAAAANPQTQRFHYISADLTDPPESVRVIEEVMAWNNGQPPDVVWANAGTARPGLFVDIPIETLRAQMDANYWTATYLAHATLNCWLRPASTSPTVRKSAPTLPRHFVITSSSLAFCSIAGYSAYSPAKAALRSLSDSLRSELNLYAGARQAKSASAATAPPADIKIHSVYPGTILSPGHAAEQQTKHPVTRVLEEGDPAQTEDEVAAIAVRELEKGGYLISTQFLGSAMRASALHGSPRNNWLVDTVFSWATSIAWLFIGPDMEGKVYKWGKENGMSSAQ